MYLITGASGRLGSELAKLLIKKGKRVVSLSRSAPDIKGVAHIACDLTNEGSINRAAAEVLAMKDSITALINCAGVYGSQPLAELTGQAIAGTYTTNAIGPILLAARLFERLKNDGADIMNIDSSSVQKPRANEIAYATSKWAMHGFGQNLRHELKATPSRVINVSPDSFGNKSAERVMGTGHLAAFLVQILELPKNIEVGEVTVNAR